MRLEDAHLEDDLNLSSLDRVELMAAIENRYQVDLNDRDFSNVNTVADLEALLKNQRRSRPRQTILTPLGAALAHYLVTHFCLSRAHSAYIKLMARPTVIGRERLKNFQGPALIISNHIAQIDIGFLMAALPMHLRDRLGVAMDGEKLRGMRYPPKNGSS